MLAHKLGLDPVRLRQVNLLQTPTLTINDLLVNSYGYPECIDQVLAASRYRDKVGRLPYGKGIGLAGSHYVSGSSKPVNRSNMPHARFLPRFLLSHSPHRLQLDSQSRFSHGGWIAN
jgi:4-hydroxybenzoyl-CoA reductase subunit alpha